MRGFRTVIYSHCHTRVTTTTYQKKGRERLGGRLFSAVEKPKIKQPQLSEVCCFESKSCKPGSLVDSNTKE